LLRSGSRRALATRSGPTGVNLLNFSGRAARQTVFHFHLHMIPCYDDDPPRLQWLPGPGDPDEIATAAELLKGGL
jgi:histidine triad (HIT) family protein